MPHDNPPDAASSAARSPKALSPDALVRTLAARLDLPRRGVAGAVSLFDAGHTVPFVARYRKEQTGGLDEIALRAVQAEAVAVRALEERRAAVLASIDEQGALTAALRREIEAAETRTAIEDLYAPHKPRRLTRGRKAREAGLEPLAEALMDGRDGDLDRLAKTLSGGAFPSPADALKGAQDIIAEDLADHPKARASLRQTMRQHGRLVCKKRRGADPDPNYKLYLDFSAPVRAVRPHQVLAIRRGEADKKLSATVALDTDRTLRFLERRLAPERGRRSRQLVCEALADGWKRLLHPALERDVRGELEDAADAHAIGVFATNLRSLLLQPPMPGRTVLGLDPGYRSGCKLAVCGPRGQVLATAVLYLHDGRKADAPRQLARMVDQHGVDVLAIGNGTASREAERVAASAAEHADRDVAWAIVSEAGASVYSASVLAGQELPQLDVSLRGAVSIARRLQDPLAELVKVDPQAIGVGLYQHDVDAHRLAEALDAVVEDVVNGVGVDLESASPALLARVAGLGPTLAARIVEHREALGGLSRRAQVLDVPGVGPKTYEQCAGFLRVRGGPEPLDATGIHPETAAFARAVLAEVGLTVGDPGLPAALSSARGRLAALARHHGVGRPTLDDVVSALSHPGRDPRDAAEPPALRTDVLSMADLEPGLRLQGTVRNVVDFGAFVDIGVKEDGLVHISQMAERRVHDPHAVVAVGDRVTVRVLEVDDRRGRISLSMREG